VKPLACVMPAYNHAAYVEEAVRSALDHSEGLVEMVAVDDASSDGTYDVLAALAAEYDDLTVLRNERNLGGVATVMRALDATRAPYVTALASDDRWLPGRARTQLDLLESGAEWSFGPAYVVDAAGARVYDEAYGPPPEADGMLRTLLRGQAIYAPTLMYRRDLLDRVGGLSQLLWEDLAVTLRFAALGEPAYLPEPLVEYRVHGANVHLGIVARREHVTAQTEAVRSLAAWPGLPIRHRRVVGDHLAVWNELERYAAGDRRLAGLRRVDARVLDGVVRRQAHDLVRDVPGDDVLKLEALLWARGARSAARAVADVRGGSLWLRATRRARRQASRVRSRTLP
jgi:glycosyltransferase involved in cell wall biosynthesis